MGIVRRGDIRTALFAFLLDRPGHGYEAMQYVAGQTDGVWRPSAGSIYPALRQLEDEGLVRSEEHDSRRVYRLTAVGKQEAESRLADRGLPWEHLGEEPREIRDMRRAVTQLQSAATEVVKLGEAEKITEAIEIVRDTRKRLYSLLAE